jgi:hypothetical protein
MEGNTEGKPNDPQSAELS